VLGILGMPSKNPERAAMRGQFFHVKSVRLCAAKILSAVSKEKYEKCSW